MPAYFCRGSGHNEKGQYSERSDDYVNNIDGLARKFETAREWVPRPTVDLDSTAEIGIIAYGTSHSAVLECRDQLSDEADIVTSYLRVRAYPFTSELAEFIGAHKRVYVVEQNRDAQMLGLMKLELAPELQSRLRSVRHYTGVPIDARSITDGILAQEGRQVTPRLDGERHYRTSAGVGGE